MSGQTIMWMHGSEVEAEIPFLQDPRVARDFTGSTFSPAVPGTHAFLIALPTPAVLDGFAMQLKEVYVLYNTSAATIDSVEVFDAVGQIAQFPNLGWSGSHQTTVDSSNRLVINPTELSRGVMVRMTVTFQLVTTAIPPAGTVTFAAIGMQVVSGANLITRFARFIASLVGG